MSNLVDFKGWRLNEQSSDNYTIENRPNYVYRPDSNGVYWEYQKIGSSSWSRVQNDSSVSSLNSKYNKNLAIYKLDDFEQCTIEGRENYVYRISKDGKSWEYQKVGSSSWQGVSNQSSVNKLNEKYGRSLKPYSEYILIVDGWEERAKAAALYLYNKGKGIGMTKIHAAAFIGNFKQESGVRHDNSQYYTKGMTLGLGYKPISLEQAAETPGWAGYGLAHWTKSRRQALVDAGANTINKQLDFVISELTNNSGAGWSSIKPTKSISSATKEVVTKYERAGAPAVAARTKNAQAVYNMIK